MSYIKDLTPISINTTLTLSVGWLDRSVPYERGITSLDFNERLLHHITFSSIQTMGRHLCNVCEREHLATIALDEKSCIKLGSCEILVFGKDCVFRAPNLIYHYVHDCSYLPPIEFINALQECPLPWTQEYISLLEGYSYNSLACPLINMVSGDILWIPPNFK